MRRRNYGVWPVLTGLALLTVPGFAGTSHASPQGAGESIAGDWSVFLPEDSAKPLAVKHCFSCHDLARVVRLRGSSDFWSDVVWTMVTSGAEIPRDEAEALVKYFGAYLGPNQASFAVPINLNTAKPETLRLLSPLTGHVDKIVKAREEGKKFEAVEDLLKIEGITKESFEKVKPFLSVK